MAKKALLRIAVVFFFLSTSIAAAEPLSLISNGESRTLSMVDLRGPSPEVNPASGPLSRSLRAKLSVKSVPVPSGAPREAGAGGWIAEATFSILFFKGCIYQQIHVYRL
jgi:hypothetical protein